MMENRIGVISVNDVEIGINDRAAEYISGIRPAYSSIGDG